MFSATQMETAIESNKRTLEIKEAEFKFMLQKNEEQICIESLVSYEETNNGIQNFLECLTEKEKKVISIRYGLNGDNPSTLKKCGEKILLSSERIRSIEASALRKIRKHAKLNNVNFNDFNF